MESRKEHTCPFLPPEYKTVIPSDVYVGDREEGKREVEEEVEEEVVVEEGEEGEVKRRVLVLSFP